MPPASREVGVAARLDSRLSRVGRRPADGTQVSRDRGGHGARLLNEHGAIEAFRGSVGRQARAGALFRQLATLRTDAPLFKDVNQPAWRLPHSRVRHVDRAPRRAGVCWSAAARPRCPRGPRPVSTDVDPDARHFPCRNRSTLSAQRVMCPNRIAVQMSADRAAGSTAAARTDRAGRRSGRNRDVEPSGCRPCPGAPRIRQRHGDEQPRQAEEAKQLHTEADDHRVGHGRRARAETWQRENTTPITAGQTSPSIARRALPARALGRPAPSSGPRPCGGVHQPHRRPIMNENSSV